MQHEIHDLYRGVDDTQLLLLLGECDLKELIEELDDDLLPITDVSVSTTMELLWYSSTGTSWPCMSL